MNLFDDSALPDHLKKKKHNDWPWPMSYLPRSVNAYGPRAPKDSPRYKPWPPRLVEGKSVTRWESSGADSIIIIPDLINKKITDKIYGKTYEAIEENGPTPGRKINVLLEWRELEWPFTPKDRAMYSPSTIQISPKGWLKMNPSFFVQWDNKDYFWRWGYRPDHLDIYYNYGPYAGRETE